MLKRTLFLMAVILLCAGCGETTKQKSEREQREVAEAVRGKEELAKWYLEHPKTVVTTVPPRLENPAGETGSSYLDGRTGAALERTVKNVISKSGYTCDKVRSIERVEAAAVRRMGADDGRWVDCGEDGVYGVMEIPGGFKALKR